MAAPLEERFIDVDGIRTFVRSRPGDGIPAIFVHGSPTNSADWLPFLERIDGPAHALDLPGFGRSARPDPAAFDYSMGAYGRFLEGAFEQLAPEGYRLVVHDWGGVGLIAAQAAPERVHRLVAIDAVPLSAAYRWHWLARAWRRRGLGELLMRTMNRSGVALLLRLARPRLRAMPPGFVDMIWDGYDAGTGRAILSLYRSGNPRDLQAGGDGLGLLDCPALVLWGDSDPYLSVADGRSYEAALPNVDFAVIDRAGHWPWIDRPDTIDRVLSFLAGPDPPA